MAVFVCGCLEGPTRYVCGDGRKVDSPGDCTEAKATTTTSRALKDLAECDKIEFDENRYACMANAAIKYKDLSVCDRIEDGTWKWVCYDKLNKSGVLGTFELPTTTARKARRQTTTSTSSTTTTIKCGNGAMDEGEDCDPGTLCQGLDGVCSILPGEPRLVTCMANGKCDWNRQVMAEGAYDMGKCIGCFGPNATDPCLCMESPKVNNTRKVSTGWRDVTENPVEKVYHKVCFEGHCTKADGDGKDECILDNQCRHNECVSGKCWMVRTPGRNTCVNDEQCQET